VPTFITGPYQYDYKTHQTIIDDKTYSDLNDDYNVPYQYNEFYDLHYFLTSLLDLYISQTLFDWIIKIYPEEVIPEEETSSDSSGSSSYTNNSDTETETQTDTSNTDTSNSSGTETTNTDISNSKETDTSDSNSSDLLSDLSDLSINSNNSKNQYIYEGRLINGVETLFKLPTPLETLKDEFFQEFTIKPDDFDEKEAIYFKSYI
jgi:hypothetical protein